MAQASITPFQAFKNALTKPWDKIKTADTKAEWADIIKEVLPQVTALNLRSILSDWESDTPLPAQTAQGAADLVQRMQKLETTKNSLLEILRSTLSPNPVLQLNIMALRIGEYHYSMAVGGRAIVKAAHLLPRGAKDNMRLFGLGKKHINSPRNILLLCKTVEEAYDRLMVMDPSLYAEPALPSAQSFRVLDGKQLLVSPGKMPFRRILSFHASLSHRLAAYMGWSTADGFTPYEELSQDEERRSRANPDGTLPAPTFDYVTSLRLAAESEYWAGRPTPAPAAPAPAAAAPAAPAAPASAAPAPAAPAPAAPAAPARNRHRQKKHSKALTGKMNRGYLALASDQFTTAINHFQHVLDIDPLNVVANNKSICYLYTCNLAQAITSIEDFILKRPEATLYKYFVKSFTQSSPMKLT
ncbi:translation initiation factor IF-2 [Planoprotostelium fungivorum]|uniref:Translation initiation factor IF-2 n=1 Tax=Planoprotostelium fungivorum TaxID=1890364 RepID=A0A2P6MQ42_9EUKA|nr:translation initiation factor IF-2 [Planoprotostelium fungivorum]